MTGAGHALASVLAILALVVAGCSRDGDDAAEPPRTTASATETTGTTATTLSTEPEEEQLAQECTNGEHGFTIRYPDGWHTNGGDVLPACSLFHPEPFEVPEATEVTGIAVMARREPVELERIAGADRGFEVLARADVEIAGREAIQRETESTGEALLPAGVRSTQYLVAVDGETLMLETVEFEGLDYERNRRVLDAMAQTLEIAG